MDIFEKKSKKFKKYRLFLFDLLTQLIIEVLCTVSTKTD